MENEPMEEKEEQSAAPSKGNSMIWVAVAVIAVIVVGVFYFTRGGYQSASPASPSSQNAPVSPANQNTSLEGSTAVTIQNFAFSPASLTIKKGESVTWTNADSASHTIVSDSNVFQSGSMANGQKFSFTFNTAGQFPYHCSIHPSMKGMIIVQ